MIKAFVFGKFYPFHKGHQAMIAFALTKCDELTVLVCCDDQELIPAKTRKAWIEATFATTNKVTVDVLMYDNGILPNTSQTSVSVSKIWSAEFKKLYPYHQLLITSEPYGQLVAGFMGIKHIPFDMDKSLYPVSATAIRNNIFGNWQYLPTAVKPYFALKVAVLGTESTGKTTLTEQLATHYHCNTVTEAGRDMIAHSNEFTFDDLYLVAAEHAKRINEVIFEDSPLLIMDTDVHITMSYAKFAFKKNMPVSHAIYNANKANLYLYLNNDVPYHQDGTRLSKTDRDLLDGSHRQILANHQVNFVEISGTWQNRFDQAVVQISKLILRSSSL